MIRYTDLKSTDRKNLREIIPLDKPFTLLIEPSSLCNFRCVHCFQGLGGDGYFPRSRGHMPLERFHRVLDPLRAWPGGRLKVLKLNLYGEPLLSPDFPEMLRLAREADAAERIETTSNASLLAPSLSDAMVDNRLDYLRVSVYGADAGEYRRASGSAFAPERIRENLAYLRRAKIAAGSDRPFVAVKMLDAFDETLNGRFREFWGGVADELYLDPPHDWIRTGGEGFIEKHYAGERLDAARRRLADGDTARRACPMAFTTMAVRSDGHVSPCCVDYAGGTNLGHIDRASLPDIWRSKAWRDFQAMQLEFRKEENPSCRQCEVCRSGHYTRDDIDGVPAERLQSSAKVQPPAMY